MSDARTDGPTGQAPDTTIVNKPPLVTALTSATFTFTSTPSAGATFQCRLDETTDFVACTSGTPFNVDEGTHTFRVRAVVGGTADPTPAEYTWKVDHSAPETTITAAPPATNAPTNFTFLYTSNEPGSTFTCKLVGPGQAGTEGSCAVTGQSYSGLTINSTYTFSVFATDLAGNKDLTPATATFVTGSVQGTTVTPTCPATTVGSGDVSIAFTSNKPAATFTCKLTGPGQAGTEGACASPKAYTGLAEGAFVFTVTATAEGNSNSATCNFTVNAIAPVVAITAPTEGATIGNAVTVNYTITPQETGLTVACTAVQGTDTKTVACNTSGAVGFSGLVAGAVTFTVAVTDAANHTASDSVSATVINAPGVDIVLSPLKNGFTRGTGSATFTLLGTFPHVTYVCTLQGATVTPCAPGTPIPWTGLADGTEVIVTVDATDTDTNQSASPFEARAIVDEQPPTLAITNPLSGSTVGPDVGIVFESDGVTFTCKLDGGDYTPCDPAMPFGTILQSGQHVVVVTAADDLGNLATATSNFIVDATGPTISFDQLPTAAACPTSTLDTQIEFSAMDMSLPVTRFNCTVDDSVTTSCGTGMNSGVYSWTQFLVNGRHTLRVVAFDRFGNPGPRNMDGTLGKVAEFFIDDTPPVVTVNVDSALDIDPGAAFFRVTSGGGGIGGYGTITIIASDPDGADSDATPDHLPLAVRSCIISRQGGANVPCPCTDVSPAGNGTLWSCTFAGLSDANNQHTVTVDVEDSCGTASPTNNPNNHATDSETWLVDSTEDLLTFNPFPAGAGEVVVDQTPLGNPEGDIVDGDITLSFGVVDPVIDDFGINANPDEYDSSVTPILRNCELDDGDNLPNATACPGETFVINATTVPTEGPHTLSVWLRDGVGNPSPAHEWTVGFFVDRTAPTIDNVDVQNAPGPETCTGAGGLQVTDGNGRVAFTSTDPPATVPDYVTYECHLTGPGTLPPDVTCVTTPTSNPTTCNCAPAHGGYDFTGLTGGTYNLRIRATDGVGHLTEVNQGFIVDLSGPTLAFVSPDAPFEGTGFREIVPLRGTGNLGTFTVTADTSTQAQGFTCSITNGSAAAEPCTVAPVVGAANTFSYTIPEALTEEIGIKHIVSIVATDCIGNPSAPASEDFFVDKTAPAFTGFIFTQDDRVIARGNVSVTITDLTTNVQSTTCTIDSPNPGTACTLTLTGATTDKVRTGTAVFSELAPGSHTISFTATDVWNHVSAVDTHPFVSDSSPGFTVLIGHDFNEVNTAPGTFDPPAQAIDRVIGNAVWLSPAQNFARPIHVLDVVGGSFNATSVGLAALGICQQVDRLNGSARDCTCGADPKKNACIFTAADVTVTDQAPASAAALIAALPTNDVVVLHDLNNPAIASALGANSNWATALQTFAAQGGVVIALDGMLDAQNPSQNFTLLGSSPFAVTTPSSVTDQFLDSNGFCGSVMTGLLTDDGFGDDIGGYRAPVTSVSYDGTIPEGWIAVDNDSGDPVVIGAPSDNSSTTCPNNGGAKP